MNKNILSTLVLLCAVIGLNAQRPQTPGFFRNQQEYLMFRIEHPNGIPSRIAPQQRALRTIEQKLDSVVGSDNFDWSRWKNVYEYRITEQDVDEASRIETNYEWADQQWVPTLKTETLPLADGTPAEQQLLYRWTNDQWELYYRVTSHYVAIGEVMLEDSLLSERYANSNWVGDKLSTYTYDEAGHTLLNMNYNGQLQDGSWVESSKYEYDYNEYGDQTSLLYSTKRGNSWREVMKDTLTYDENHLCLSQLTRTKGGWGPMADTWMDAYKYEFEYVDGELASETYYEGGFGWFTQEMTLDNVTAYTFDSYGNEILKTANVFNESEFVPRDVYSNTFNNAIEAASVLGMEQVWKSTLSNGMGYVLNLPMPIYSQWLSCSIISEYLDTQFNLYYSSLSSVEEELTEPFRVVAAEGLLRIENESPVEITVFDVLGRVVAKRSQVDRCELHLNPGLYIVSNGNQVVKAVVR